MLTKSSPLQRLRVMALPPQYFRCDAQHALSGVGILSWRTRIRESKNTNRDCAGWLVARCTFSHSESRLTRGILRPLIMSRKTPGCRIVHREVNLARQTIGGCVASGRSRARGRRCEQAWDMLQHIE